MRLLFGSSALGGKRIELKAEALAIRLSEEEVNAVIAAMRERLKQVDALDESEVEQIIRKVSESA